MTVVTLLDLEHKRTVTLQCRTAMQEFGWNRLAAPGIHHRTPWRVLSQMSQCAQPNGDQENCEHRDGPPLPALLAFTGNEWKRKQDNDSDGGTDEQNGRLGRGRQE